MVENLLKFTPPEKPPHMTITQADYIIRNLASKEVTFENGLSDEEVSAVERMFALTFPPDLKLFLQISLPISKGFVNWRQALSDPQKETEVQAVLAWPLEGMLFDIRSNNFWMDSWGSKPEKYQDIISIAKKEFATYPLLIPIYSHRYIPGHPNASGNPVFSVYQMDIIYYGYDLATYFAKEFHFNLSEKDFENPTAPKVNIPFWSAHAE